MFPKGLQTYLSHWLDISSSQPPLLLIGHPDTTTKISRAIAQTLACTTNGSMACTVCTSCRQVESGIYPDLIEYTSTTPHTIVTIRSLEKQLAQRPLHGITIIRMEMIEQFNTISSQALLKTLEEPPVTTRFILTTHFPGRLLSTIRSRCTRFSIISPVTSTPDISSLSFSSEEELSDERLAVITSFLNTQLRQKGPDATFRRAFQRLRDYYKIRELRGNKKLAEQVLIASLREIR